MYTVIIEKRRSIERHEHLSHEEAHALIESKWCWQWEFWVCYEPVGVFWNISDNPCF